MTIVAGKGGVGKTTVAASLAFAAASAGARTLLVETDGRGDLAALFGRSGRLGYAETLLADAGELDGRDRGGRDRGGAGPDGAAGGPGRGGPDNAPAGARKREGWLAARSLAPDQALVEYLDGHGLRWVTKHLSSTGTIEVIATAVPGIRELLVLGKVRQIEQRAATGDPEAPEVVVVDAPAAGHAVSLLSSPYGLLDAASSGPIREQAASVVAMLSDPARCQVMLVTLPEETPVNETVETAFLLEDRAGVKLAPVIVNGVWPVLDLAGPEAEGLAAAGTAAGAAVAERVRAAARFRMERQAQQGEQIGRLADRLPLPQVHLPYLFGSDTGPDRVEELAFRLAAGLSRGEP